MYTLAGKRIYVAGHEGMVGRALVRRLAEENCEILTADRSALDLRDQTAVQCWMADREPQAIILAAAKVGGILANDSAPADFLFDNLMIETNVIDAARVTGVEKLLFLGSSCIYPRDAPQPIREEALLTGPLEPTNEFYAVAKIAGVKLVQAYRRQYGCDFISAMPANLYGPGDTYDPLASHVLPALLQKAHRVKTGETDRFEIWGSGTPRREFLHVDDCADACLFLMKYYSDEAPINVGFGKDIAIAELARLICDMVGVVPDFIFDTTKPDGVSRKLIDSERLRALGWAPKIPLVDGVRDAYAAFVAA